MKKIKNVLYFDKDSFFLGPPGYWVGIHIDTPWGDEKKEFNAPNRIYLHLGPLGGITIGLPDNMETVFHDLPEEEWQPVKIGEHEKTIQTVVTYEKVPWFWQRLQPWTLLKGYRNNKSRIISYGPPQWMKCQHQIGASRSICGLFRWHFWSDHFGVENYDSQYRSPEKEGTIQP